LKEAADFTPSTENNEENWDSLHVAYIASGDPEEDRRLAALAREQGKVVFLRDLPEESDEIFQSVGAGAENTAQALSASKNNTKTALSWETIQQKLWAATVRKRSRTEIAVNIFSAIALMIVGHLLFTFFSYDRLTLLWNELEVSESFFYYILGGLWRR
jgi:hypothetical protein